MEFGGCCLGVRKLTKEEFIESLRPLVTAMKDARVTVDVYNDKNYGDFNCMVSPATLVTPLTLFHFPESVKHECVVGYDGDSDAYYAYLQVNSVWFEASGKTIEGIFI